MGIGEWVRGNGQRRMGQGLREWIPPCGYRKGKGTARTRRPESRRVRARTFSCVQLLRFIVFVEGTRGTVGGTACSGLVLCGSARLSQRGARDALCGFFL